MSSYTIQLRHLVELTSLEEVESWFKDYNLADYLTAEEITTIRNRNTWTEDKLASLIVNHYWVREIGLETPELFQHQAKVAMKEIMEEKAPLIYSASIKYDPMINVDFTETYEEENKQDGSADGLNVNSDTPQGQINKARILQGDYASSTGASEGTSHSEGTQKWTRKQKGNSGTLTTAQALVKQYRENIIMINRDIIKDLSSLFMEIY